jgi:hypothetical protein
MPAQQTPWIVYGALIASTFIYLLVLVVMGQPEGTLNPQLGIVLGVVALGNSVATLVVPKIMLRGALLNAGLGTREIEVASESVVLRGTTKVVVFDDPGKARGVARQAAFTHWILSWALAESVAICGLVLRFLGAEWLQIVPFFVLCWVLYAARPPIEARVFAELEAVYKAKLTD